MPRQRSTRLPRRATGSLAASRRGSPSPQPAAPAQLHHARSAADSQGREAAEAFLIALDREFSRRIEGGGRGRDDRAAILERLEPSQREWNRERVVVVGLRIPTGAEQLERAGLNAEETARVVQRAVDRAYPFLEREGIRNGAVWSRHDRALDVQVLVPERLGWTPNQLRSPQFQQRFITGFHREITNVGRDAARPGPGASSARRRP